MRVLLTGAAGFIGGAVSAALLEAGHEVIGVDLMIEQAHGRDPVPVPESGPDSGPVVHRLDVRDAETWSDLLDGVDAVCHQAAVVGAGVRVEDLIDYAGHNDLGTAALLVAMHRRSVDRLVLASSMVVYGEGRYACAEHGDQPARLRSLEALAAGEFEQACPVCSAPMGWRTVDEDARLEPRSGYAASKLAQENYVSAWCRQAAAGAVALRYHNVYGPRMPQDTPYAGVAAMFRSALERGEAPRVFEDGGQMRDFVHVADVARANVLALEAVLDRPGFAPYNVCSGTPISIRDVAVAVAGARTAGTAQSPVVTGEFRPGDVRHVVASPDRARSELGFTARISPTEGLAAFATAPLRPRRG